MAGFPWSECQVKKLATSHCTNRKQRVNAYDTHGDVYSHHLSYCCKVRKGGGYFYGKSSNENHIKSL